MSITLKPRFLDTKNKFVTYRRLWLDTLLTSFKVEMQGTVIDIGGKKGKKRGNFSPPDNSDGQWWHINIDLTTTPDIYADVLNLPIMDGVADVVLCTEVLEHLPNPQICANETYRILKKNGVAFISVPFIYPVHADPYDFQRFTADGLRQLLDKFTFVDICPMGGFPGTIGMLIEIGTPGIKGTNIIQKLIRRGLIFISRQLYQFDLNSLEKQPELWKKFTTGYFIRAVK